MSRSEHNYVGNFASKIITENLKRLARRVGSRQRSVLTAAKPFTDTEQLFAGGAVGCLSTDFTAAKSFTDTEKLFAGGAVGCLSTDSRPLRR